MESYLVHELRLFAPVWVNGSSGYAHVDTGSVSSLVRASHARGIARTGASLLRGGLGAGLVEQCQLNEVEFLGQAFNHLPVKVIADDVGQFDRLPFPVMMVAGSDLLYHQALHLNFSRGKIGFLESIPASIQKTSSVVHLDSQLGPAFITIDLGNRALRAAFDVGSAYSVLNTSRLHLFTSEVYPIGREEVLDATGRSALVDIYWHAHLAIAEQPLGDVRFLAMDLSALEDILGSELDFILGYNVMQAHDWVVDRAQGRLLLDIPKRHRPAR